MATATRRPLYPDAARRHRLLSSLVARRAVTEARKATTGGPRAVAAVVVAHQLTQARMSTLAFPRMLAAQGIRSVPEAQLSLTAFATEPTRIVAMLEETTELERLVEALVQDAGRAAESVSVAVRPDLGYAWHLNLPSCSRCVALAGRVYRYSEGFLRHPGCDDTMIPVREGDDRLAVDPVGLAEQGLVGGLSHADMQALKDGADFNQVVNVRRTAAGLREAGRVLARRDRLTPEGIYRLASDRDEAVALLRRNGYVL